MRKNSYVDLVTHNPLEYLVIIEATGKTSGHFEAQFSGFDGSTLYEIIPDFHNTKSGWCPFLLMSSKNRSDWGKWKPDYISTGGSYFCCLSSNMILFVPR